MIRLVVTDATDPVAPTTSDTLTSTVTLLGGVMQDTSDGLPLVQTAPPLGPGLKYKDQPAGTLPAHKRIELRIAEVSSVTQGLYLDGNDLKLRVGQGVTVHTATGEVRAKVDGTTITFDASGNLKTVLGAGGGTITLTGDVSGSGSGTISVSLASVGTPGTYTKVTTDSKGRVTSGSGIAAGDVGPGAFQSGTYTFQGTTLVWSSGTNWKVGGVLYGTSASPPGGAPDGALFVVYV